MDLSEIPLKSRQRSLADPDMFSGPFSEELEADVSHVEAAPDELQPQALARRVVDLITAGEDPKDAAREQGLPAHVVELPSLQKRIKELLARAYLPAELQRALVRAGRMEIFMDMQEQGIKDQDIGKLKIALEASKQIGQDPEIGLTQAPQQVVNIELGGLRELLEKTEPLEGFEAPKLEGIEWQDEENTNPK